MQFSLALHDKICQLSRKCGNICFPGGALSRFGITLKCPSVSDARPTPSWQRKTSTSPTPTSATSTGPVRTETVGGHSALTASCSTPTRRMARIPATSDTMFPTSARAERSFSGPSQVGFDRFYQRSLNARIPIISTMGAHTQDIYMPVLNLFWLQDQTV